MQISVTSRSFRCTTTPPSPSASDEQPGHRLLPVLGRDPVRLLDRDPRQLPPLLLDALGVLLQLPLGGQQLLAPRLPLLFRPDLHRTSLALTSSSLGRYDGGKLIGSCEPERAGVHRHHQPTAQHRASPFSRHATPIDQPARAPTSP